VRINLRLDFKIGAVVAKKINSTYTVWSAMMEAEEAPAPLPRHGSSTATGFTSTDLSVEMSFDVVDPPCVRARLGKYTRKTYEAGWEELNIK
jgi:hypothetical protein